MGHSPPDGGFTPLIDPCPASYAYTLIKPLISDLFMNTNPLHEGAMMIHGSGIGTVSYEMIQKRAAELAVIDGRLAEEASEADLDQAAQELMEGGEPDPTQTLLESVPESERWDPVLGSVGHEAAVTLDDNEDEEGRSVAERLVQAGVAEADHDQKLAAAQSAALENE